VDPAARDFARAATELVSGFATEYDVVVFIVNP
jgi:hypothetical protein